MLKLNIDEIISKIKKEESFSCTSHDGGFTLIINEYVPFICAAIHNGGNFRADLRDNCLLNKFDRWYEEDPHTADFVSSLPIRIIGNDSRFEYDLNRGPEDCVYETAWGREVWKQPLDDQQKNKSLEKHANFYKVVEALVKKIESKFKTCLVYDIHSYNFKRITEVEPPLFNIGTTNVNTEKYRPFIDDWIKRLNNMEVFNLDVQAHENLVFQGKGYFLKFISDRFKNTLVLATEVRKSYCDELSGDLYPEVITDLENGFKQAIVENSNFFLGTKANKSKKKYRFLSSDIEPVVKLVDDGIYSIFKDFDIFNFVNPINVESEKKKFFKSRFSKEPEFKYRPLEFDPFQVKRQVYDLPIENIKDVSLRTLYHDVIEGFVDQVNLLAHRGSQKFLYSSLKYFGAPTELDIKCANYILHCPDDSANIEMISSEETKELVSDMVKRYGFKCKIELSRNIPSKAVFSPAKKLLKIKKGTEFARTEALGLAHHEIGVHMLTTANAWKQPLKVFRIGLPLNTLTQEGLAILSEYFSGCLTLNRLKELALRVVAVDHLVKTQDFVSTYHYLCREYGVDRDRAFYITTRIYRGGGFTKDHLYLKGFLLLKSAYEEKSSLDHLLIGKTSISHQDILYEMVNRGVIDSPEYITKSFLEKNQTLDETIEFILKGLKY